MKAAKNHGLILAHRLENFLLSYRTTPHTTTGTPLCELLMGRSLCTRWHLLRPDVERRVSWQQSQQKDRYDQHARQREFTVGQSVMAKNFGSGSAWIPGVIVEQIGPLTYAINISDGRPWKHHVDHIKEYAMPHPCP